MLKRWLFALASTGAVCTTLAVTAGTASANINVVAAIQHENRVILVSKALTQAQKLEAADKDPARLSKVFDALATKLDGAASYVSHSSADSSRQSEGRADWVGGVRDIAGALYKLGHAFHYLAIKDPEKAEPYVKAAEKKLKAGEALGTKAGHLLNTNF